jgi:hypothetical protein
MYSPISYKSLLQTWSNKRHIFTAKDGVPLSTAVINSANKNDIKIVMNVIGNKVIKRPGTFLSTV